MRQPEGDFWNYLRARTAARIALGRTGDSLPTRRVLEFELAQASARDAVWALLDSSTLLSELSTWHPIAVRSRAADRLNFLQRPDLGRLLADESVEALAFGAFDVALVIADGLSARAVQTQAVPLCRLLISAAPDVSFAPPAVALQARVALGDEIAKRQGAETVIVLIGERPGLSASDSMGAYITFDPRPGETRDSDRNCVSNIRPGGLSLAEATRRILAILKFARAIRRTGTLLKEDEALAALPPPL